MYFFIATLASCTVSSLTACWTSFIVATWLINSCCALTIACPYLDFKLLSKSCNLLKNGSVVVLSASFIAAWSAFLFVSSPFKLPFAVSILFVISFIACCVDWGFSKIWRPSTIALSYFDFKSSGEL